MGDGVLVLLFLLPEADVVVVRPVVLVATRGVVLAVVLPGPRAPDVDTPLDGGLSTSESRWIGGAM